MDARFEGHDCATCGETTTCSRSRGRTSSRRSTSAYLEAGADIIETNSFTATSVALADYGLEAELAYRHQPEGGAHRAARGRRWTAETPDRPRFVAGVRSDPTNKTLSLSPDVNDPAFRGRTFDQMRTAYAEQVRALVDGGVDLLLVETIFDTLNAKAALVAIDEVRDSWTGAAAPVMISVAITDASGRTLSGQTVEAFLQLDVPRGAARPSASTARWAPMRCVRTWRAGQALGDLRHELSQRRPAQRVRRATTKRPRPWPRSCASSPRAGS